MAARPKPADGLEHPPALWISTPFGRSRGDAPAPGAGAPWRAPKPAKGGWWLGDRSAGKRAVARVRIRPEPRVGARGGKSDHLSGWREDQDRGAVLSPRSGDRNDAVRPR